MATPSNTGTRNPSQQLQFLGCSSSLKRSSWASSLKTLSWLSKPTGTCQPLQNHCNQPKPLGRASYWGDLRQLLFLGLWWQPATSHLLLTPSTPCCCLSARFWLYTCLWPLDHHLHELQTTYDRIYCLRSSVWPPLHLWPHLFPFWSLNTSTWTGPTLGARLGPDIWLSCILILPYVEFLILFI